MNESIGEVPKCLNNSKISFFKKCGHSWNDEICVKFLCKIKFNTLDNFKKMFKYFFKTYLKIFKKKTEGDFLESPFWYNKGQNDRSRGHNAVLWDEMTVLKGQISPSLGQSDR